MTKTIIILMLALCVLAMSVELRRLDREYKDYVAEYESDCYYQPEVAEWAE